MTRYLLFATFLLCMMFAVVCDWQTGKLATNDRQIDTLRRELAGQMFEVQRARAVAAEMDELRFIAGTMQTNDGDLYAIAKAAWKYQRPDVSAWLILAIVHRESNFDPMAVSYVNGNPCAYGVMQINARAWGLDPYKLMDIDYNVQQGVRILSGYIAQSGGDIGRALLRYYGGSPDIHGFGYSERVLGSKYYGVGQ